MWKQWIRLACLVGMLGGSIGAKAQTEETPNTAQLETVLVTGTQLGPGLWTVRKGDHVMYVLGIQSPIPKRMQWYSEDVLNTVANSQALLAPPSAQFSGIGFFRGLTLLPSLFRARENPDDKTLQEIVPPELYARWQSLKAKYLPRSRKVEHWRPIFAGFKLYDEAIKESGLRTDTGVWKAHDATALMAAQPRAPYPGGILIDQGLADKFLAEQLHPHLFEAACQAVGQPLTLRRHAGYDHGYYFIATFIDDHLRFHAQGLG